MEMCGPIKYCLNWNNYQLLKKIMGIIILWVCFRGLYLIYD